MSTHRSLVAEQIAQFSFVVYNWIGTNLQLHPEEIDLLQPQAAFRRVYRNLADNREFELLVVYSAHCRTLSGHEPGRCMTGQGWICCSDEMQSWNTGEATVCGRDFVFQNGSSREQVTSILVAPSFGASGRTEFIAMAAADFRLDPFGALAIRISTSEPLEIADWNAQILPFVTALQPMIRQVHFP